MDLVRALLEDAGFTDIVRGPDDKYDAAHSGTRYFGMWLKRSLRAEKQGQCPNVVQFDFVIGTEKETQDVDTGTSAQGKDV